MQLHILKANKNKLHARVHINCVDLNVCQREYIMADSFSSQMLHFPIDSIGSLLIAKKEKRDCFCVLCIWQLHTGSLAVTSSLLRPQAKAGNHSRQ